MKMKLLSPAGDFESLKMAVFYGADEVYLGVRDFNARNNIEGFDLNGLKKAVDFASARSLFKGTSDMTFSPESPMTRGMLAMVLHNLEDNPPAASNIYFPDVAAGAWYADAVRWASAKGIISGYDNGQVGAEDDISREQLAVILWRYAGSPAASSSTLNFTDAAMASGYATSALSWATEVGIISGTGNGALSPKAQASRAQVAQMLKNFITVMN